MYCTAGDTRASYAVARCSSRFSRPRDKARQRLEKRPPMINGGGGSAHSIRTPLRTRYQRDPETLFLSVATIQRRERISSLFTICDRFPKLDVAGSSPVPRSIVFRYVTAVCGQPDQQRESRTVRVRRCPDWMDDRNVRAHALGGWDDGPRKVVHAVAGGLNLTTCRRCASARKIASRTVSRSFDTSSARKRRTVYPFSCNSRSLCRSRR